MSDKFQSPEKQLLNLIEKPATSARGQARSVPRRGRARRPVFAPQVSIRTLNLFLIGAILVLAVYLAGSIFSSLGAIEEKLRRQTEVEAFGSKSGAEDPFAMQDIGAYLARVAERDIFRMGGRRKVAEDQPEAGPSSKFMEATGDLRLVGISWSDDPDVMIEDIARHVTFFLKQDETMESGITVKEIRKESVILEFEGERLELK
ncbi:MAG: hypothetical protein MJA29_10110 [Candidatus Omnitrophica bacterium]|nr:hypothetical protein [Candidatus Omnitrophota bacterium]